MAFLGNTFLSLALFAGTYYYVQKRAAIAAERAGELQAAEKLASVCRLIDLAGSPAVAVDYIEQVKKEPSIIFGVCLDGSGKVQAHSDPRWLGRTWGDMRDLGMMNISSPQSVVVGQGDGSLTRKWFSTVTIGGRRAGLAVLAYDENRVQDNMRRKFWGMMRVPVMVASITFALSAFFALALAWNLSQPIGKLVEATRAIGKGELETQTPIASRNDELGVLAQEINVMAARLKTLDELKQDFVANVSHDLISPMTAMSMLVSNILSDKERSQIPAKYLNILMMVKDCATRLSMLVGNVLSAAKIKAGRMEYHLARLDLKPVLENIVSLYSMLAASEQIGLTAEIPDVLSPVLADGQHLEQALMNLVSNAIKFTPSAGSVTVSAVEHPGAVEIRVVDTGAGIAPEEMTHLFERFYQADMSAQRRKKIKGTGLGLSIVKSSVEAMGGRVAVNSQIGEGTTFSITLPVARA